ncbi:MAG: A/G-specific adenine glycosylase [Acidobacteria bacterium]|nr:A/G-specific adenine glycosylase [Acidobacteriota bacterium]
MSRAERVALRRSLLRWYAQHQRRLPWRETSDPYRILVSEYLLQQTRVDQALPFYERLINQFPSVQSLAAAHLTSLLKIWEGLGYYQRARNLHRTAKLIVNELGGRIPSTVAGLRQLPGCGPYTSAAVASIAFDVREPVLDGNAVRVLSRLDGLTGDLRIKAGRELLRQVALQLLPRDQPGQFNQALMELGSTICRPRRPRCGICCWKTSCTAFREGLVGQIPMIHKKGPLPNREIAVGIIWFQGKVLVAQRKPEALLGGLWEFPGGKRRPQESLRDCCAREILEEVGLSVEVVDKVTVLKYAYSHFKVRLHVFRCVARTTRARAIACQRVRWESPGRLDKYPFPAANKALIEALREKRIGPP